MGSRGTNYITEEGSTFYFHYGSRNLMAIAWGKQREAASPHETDFGRFLFREYGINANDGQLMTNISSFFTEDDLMEPIVPRRVLCLEERGDIRGTSIYYQLSDSSLLNIQANRVRVEDNGNNNVMFVKGQVDPLDSRELIEEIERQKVLNVECWWEYVINGLNVVQTTEEVSVENTKRLYSLLPYISPWFLRWNRSQLPIEIVTGEAGSGKSSLLELRQLILTGHTKLRNSPTDMRDWYAGVSAAGGVYTMDNVQLVNKPLKQKLSDEICRIITEAHPHIEMRKLYTTAENMRIPVSCTFAITAIVPPFNNQDILQRSFPLHLNAIRHKGLGIAAHESNWVENCLELRGGRIAWVAHHVVILQKLLKAIELQWDLSLIHI